MYEKIKETLKPCPLCGNAPVVSIEPKMLAAFIKCKCGHGFVYYAKNRQEKITEDVFPKLAESWNIAASV